MFLLDILDGWRADHWLTSFTIDENAVRPRVPTGFGRLEQQMNENQCNSELRPHQANVLDILIAIKR
jgi:hypothetical protein